jgi:peptidoglycan LD-endopeptidase CwlK
MPSTNILDLNPHLQPLAQKFLDQCKAAGVNAFLTCTYRSNGEQAALYAQGRSKSGKVVTNAKSGQSPHNRLNALGKPAARAFDFAIKDETGKLDWNAEGKRWKTAISIGIALGLDSGRDILVKRNGKLVPLGDNPHFQLKDWKNDGIYM